MANCHSIGDPSNLTISGSFEMIISGVSPAPTYMFLQRLSTYAAALITHFVNLRTLHSLHARHTLQEFNPTSSVKVPFILMRLSELLPSKNRSFRTKKPWARDSVKLMFQGLEPTTSEEIAATAPFPAPSPTMTGKDNAKATRSDSPSATVPAVVQPDAPERSKTQFYVGEGAVIVTEARMSVPVPQALTILKQRVDRDVAFDPKLGVFAFRLRSKVGESVIPAFIERAIRVERLVDFVEVLHKHEKTLKCEYVSLGRIIFTYGNARSGDVMNLEGPSGYKVIVDFGTTDSMMTLEFERGNPHLRIADYLAKVLNEKQGLDGVATLIPFTLPALRALDKIESTWASLSTKGSAIVYVRAVEWYIIRYDIFSKYQSSLRKVMFEIRLQQRQGSPWWYIKRADSRNREGDDIDMELKSLWNSTGGGWKGMRVSAVAQPAGMEDLMGKLDDVIRGLVSGAGHAVVTAPTQAPASVKPPQRAPEAPMMAQPQRQQPTLNQSQRHGQSLVGDLSQQGRLGVKREVVEID